VSPAPEPRRVAPGAPSGNVVILRNVEGWKGGVRIVGGTDNTVDLQTRNVERPAEDIGGKRNRWKIKTE